MVVAVVAKADPRGHRDLRVLQELLRAVLELVRGEIGEVLSPGPGRVARVEGGRVARRDDEVVENALTCVVHGVTLVQTGARRNGACAWSAVVRA